MRSLPHAAADNNNVYLSIVAMPAALTLHTLCFSTIVRAKLCCGTGSHTHWIPHGVCVCVIFIIFISFLRGKVERDKS